MITLTSIATIFLIISIYFCHVHFVKHKGEMAGMSDMLTTIIIVSLFYAGTAFALFLILIINLIFKYLP